MDTEPIEHPGERRVYLADLLHWIMDGEALTTPEERAEHGDSLDDPEPIASPA